MSDTSHHVLTGKVDITSNLLVGSSHLFVDTNNNRVGLVTTDPHAGLHVNSNAYVNTDLRVGNQIEINATAGRIKAASFEGDGSLLQNTPPGADGAAATIAVGTTTTGAAGTSASVTNSGTTSAAVFNFTIPKGDQGIQGIPGNDGANGANGADGADGTNYFTLSGSNIYRTTGRVGIGTASPRALLDVSGPTGIPAILTSGANDSEGDIAVPTDQAVQIGHWDDGTSTFTNRFYISSSGNIGIGTTSPEQKLEVHGNILLGENQVKSYIHGGNSMAVSSDADVLIVADSNDTSGAVGSNSIIFGAGSAIDTDNRNFTYAQAYPNDVPRVELMRLTAEAIEGDPGRLGLGTASPEHKLHLHANHEYLYQRFSTTANSTTEKFDIAQWHSSRSNGDHGVMFNNRANSDMRFITNNSEVMRLKTDGNVGIGASSPEEKLHVAGDMTVRGNSRFDVKTDNADHIIAGNWYSSSDSLCLVSAGSININMDYNANDTNKTIDFRTNTSTNGGTLLMRLNEGGSVLIGDQHVVPTGGYSSAQFILGGTHNSGFNNSNQIKLLITGGNNDGGAPKYIQCEDENGYDIFIVKGATSEGGGNALLYIKGEVKMQSASDRYSWIPGNDGWLRLQGAASGQGNLYVDGSYTYTSLAVGNFYAAGSTRFSSDDRIKHFEEEIPNALELIQQLKPYKYKKTSKIYDEDYTGDIGEDWKWEIGLIAQDVEKIPYLEHIVSKPEDNPGGTYGLNYIEFIGVCVQGIKDLKKELQSEKEKVATMELLVASLVKRVGDLENLVI